ncbi:EAL domain-containing protein [Roseobacter sp. MH60115]|uniref:EAL domain-containing protein n=1 Tax=Roseobacter sp. MH60115 TaxID=2785324 RepID=UPI0018A24970|nr:EAL domain-containing protein [Roseobacter sp. MH60115]
MRRNGNATDVSLIGPLVDALAVPAFFVDCDYRIVAANDLCRTLLAGRNGEALSGQGLPALIHSDRAQAVCRHLDLARSGKAALDVVALPVDVSDVLHFFSATLLRFHENEPGGFLCQSADVLSHAEDGQIAEAAPDTPVQRHWRFAVEGGKILQDQPSGRGMPAVSGEYLHDYLQSVTADTRDRLKWALAALISTVTEEICLTYQATVGHKYDVSILAKGCVTRRDAEGFPTEISLVETDISDVSRCDGSDTSLAESELRWKTAVLSAKQGVWDHDFEQNRHFLSKTWRELRGLNDDDQVPETTEDWLKTIHPQDLDHIKAELERLDSGETDDINYKFRQRHSNGQWVWFLSRGRIVRRDAEGLPARIIGTDIDITDIKTVEIESQRMAERLGVAMEAAGMARWEFTVNSDQAFWDDRLLEMFGIKDGQNLRTGADWSTFIHPDDREATVAYTEDCLQKEQDVACDYRLVARDGTLRHIRTRGKFVNDSETGPRYYGVNFDITQDQQRAQELEDARARLEHESRHDALTGLANRRRLDDVYTEYMRNMAATDVRLAVLHFDIDHFKQINDTLGHDAGDATLKHAADILRRNAPEGALVSRVGGDEFVALLFDAPEDVVLEEIAERIIDDMSRPYFYGAQECNIGTSIGIATVDGQVTPECNLFIDADLALYEAKKAGRGRYRFYNRAMKEEARRRKNSFDALLAGFDQGEITCHYQPQFDTNTLELTGLEALVRWESAKFGLIMPEEFLQTAEDMGLLAQFDELVLRRALYDMKQWQGAGLAVPPISVNVSANRLNDPSLGDRLRELELPRGMLSFELLESAFLDARNDVVDRNLKKISEMGIDIEIDDFGSGHASIASLLQVAPRRLKIDRTLIQPIVDSRRQRELVKTIIGIGRMLDIRVVAEGVETAAHVPILKNMGCCYLQGYGLARPMDADAVRDFLAEIGETQGRLRLA